MLAQIADDLGEANAYGHAQQSDALRAARVPAQLQPSQRRAVLAPISEESFGTSRCAGPHGGHTACDVSASECIERFDSGLRMDRMGSSTLSSTSTISAPSTPVGALQARSDPSASSSTRERTTRGTSERERLDDAYHQSSLPDNGANSAAAQAKAPEGAAKRPASAAFLTETPRPSDGSAKTHHSFRGSFSAGSKPIFTSKYAFFSIFQNLQENHLLASNFCKFLPKNCRILHKI